MGSIFHKLEPHITHVSKESIFVEIGSDRYEGSTRELDRLAGKHGIRLISVDILPNAKQRMGRQLINTDFVVSDGRKWAKEFTGPPISCLYLDNFDYIWDTNDIQDNIQKQLDAYASRGQTMNNQNSQIEHFSQLLSLYPHLTHDATVMFDDTYTFNDCWIGKSGPGVVFLLVKGWEILETTTDCGVIMKRKCA